MTSLERIATGLPALDALLGGGLLPGTMTVVMGATGIGKTQLGLHFSNHGLQQEGERGILFDLTSRGDSQNHADYAKRLFDWEISERSISENGLPADVWNRDLIRRDYFHVFRRSGRRVTIRDMEFDDWKEWKADFARKLDQTIAWFYGNFAHGVRRCVIDGIEPTDKASDSFQIHVFDYIYHQILRKESAWVARDLFRVHFRENEDTVSRHAYDHNQVGCLLLSTSHDVMLDDLLERPIESGDILSNANTIILMGKTRQDGRIGRAIHVAKHRGSSCSDAIVPFEVTGSGLNLLDAP